MVGMVIGRERRAFFEVLPVSAQRARIVTVHLDGLTLGSRNFGH
jgi:hypothetical protein